MADRPSLHGVSGRPGRSVATGDVDGSRRAAAGSRPGVPSRAPEQPEQPKQPAPEGPPPLSEAAEQSIVRALAEVQQVMAKPASAIQDEAPEVREAALRQVHILLRRLLAHAHS